ncbi:alpha/beta hydrolase [Paenibacillus sp.]|uniref:alpha/beta fold hydrolase n=1 Tax=Paenibacillus sp. TaxID=58172 RepID=UPI002D457C8C|nr:alpha/beta hydrolase [Paenibacillus sp.]HZG86540.1 alpha/beta hydrolase [Paenibacillus sp.]
MTKQRRQPTIFKTEAGRERFLAAYDETMKLWNVPYETFEIETEYGDCHIIASGPHDAPPVVLFHGMTGNSSLWYETVAALQSFRTYCIDAPGDLGKSRVKRLIKTPQDAVAWIDQVLDRLGLASAHFIGHSMGGWLSATYVLARPERVRRLALVAPVATFLPVPFWKLLRYIYPALLRPSPERIRKAWSIFAASGYVYPAAVMDMIICAYTHCRPLLPVIPRVYPASAWNAVRHPVLFLVGDEESIYDAKRAAARISAALPQAIVSIVPGAGHVLTVERPETVGRELTAFLGAAD